MTTTTQFSLFGNVPAQTQDDKPTQARIAMGSTFEGEARAVAQKRANKNATIRKCSKCGTAHNSTELTPTLTNGDLCEPCLDTVSADSPSSPSPVIREGDRILLNDWEENGYSDSDWYIVYWDTGAQTAKLHMSGTTRFAGGFDYANTRKPTQDDLEELEKARAYLKDRIFEKIKSAETSEVEEPQTIEEGDRVRLLCDHKNRKRVATIVKCEKCWGSGDWVNPRNEEDKRECYACEGEGKITRYETKKGAGMITITAGTSGTVEWVGTFRKIWAKGYNTLNRETISTRVKLDDGTVINAPLSKLRHDRECVGDSILMARADSLSYDMCFKPLFRKHGGWLSSNPAGAIVKEARNRQEEEDQPSTSPASDGADSIFAVEIAGTDWAIVNTQTGQRAGGYLYATEQDAQTAANDWNRDSLPVIKGETCGCGYSASKPGVGYVNDQGWECKRCGETHTARPSEEEEDRPITSSCPSSIACENAPTVQARPIWSLLPTELRQELNAHHLRDQWGTIKEEESERIGIAYTGIDRLFWYDDQAVERRDLFSADSPAPTNNGPQEEEGSVDPSPIEKATSYEYAKYFHPALELTFNVSQNGSVGWMDKWEEMYNYIDMGYFYDEPPKVVCMWTDGTLYATQKLIDESIIVHRWNEKSADSSSSIACENAPTVQARPIWSLLPTELRQELNAHHLRDQWGTIEMEGSERIGIAYAGIDRLFWYDDQAVERRDLFSADPSSSCSDSAMLAQHDAGNPDATRDLYARAADLLAPYGVTIRLQDRATVLRQHIAAGLSAEIVQQWERENRLHDRTHDDNATMAQYTIVSKRDPDLDIAGYVIVNREGIAASAFYSGSRVQLIPQCLLYNQQHETAQKEARAMEERIARSTPVERKKAQPGKRYAVVPNIDNTKRGKFWRVIDTETGSQIGSDYDKARPALAAVREMNDKHKLDQFVA